MPIPIGELIEKTSIASVAFRMPGKERSAAKPTTREKRHLWTRTMAANNHSFAESFCSPIANPSKIECAKLFTIYIIGLLIYWFWSSLYSKILYSKNVSKNCTNITASFWLLKKISTNKNAVKNRYNRPKISNKNFVLINITVHLLEDY